MKNLLPILLVVLAVPVFAPAQNDSGMGGVNFQGQVRYENNAPAQFVPVELWTDGESTWRTVITTDRQGKFSTGAPCMIIQYRVAVPGYRPVQERVDISINPCRAFENISLRPLPGTTLRGSTTPGASIISARIAAIPLAASKEFDAGYAAVKKDDFEGAIPHLQKAVELYPKYAEAYQLLGVAQLQLNRGAQAESSLTQAIEIEEKMPRAQYLLGVLYAMTGRVTLAEKPLTRFAELDPENPDAYFELAKIKFALNKFPDAELNARKAISLHETSKNVQIVLAYALLRQNKPREARQVFQHFVEENPDNPMTPEVRQTIAQIDARIQPAKNSLQE